MSLYDSESVVFYGDAVRIAARILKPGGRFRIGGVELPAHIQALLWCLPPGALIAAAVDDHAEDVLAP
jgi:hypothetical protein